MNWHDVKVGDLVYANYMPAVCGVVEEVVKGEPYPRLPHHCHGVDYGNRPDTLRVRLLKPKGGLTHVTNSVFAFRDFRELAESTRRKADKHEATLARLEDLRGRIPRP